MPSAAPHPLLSRFTTRGFAYEASGQGAVLVCVHGGPGTDHRLFRPYLDRLAVDTTVVFFDLPGHGQSAPAEDYGLSSMAGAIADVRAALGVDRIALLGNSYGGFLSLTYALEYPEVVSALVVVDTSASYGFRAESLAVAERRGTPRMLASLRRLWDGGLAGDAEFRDAWRDILPLYFARLPKAEIDGLADRCSYRAETRRRVLPTLPGYDLRGRLGEIGAPALVIVGRHDWITSVGQAEELAAGLRRGRLVVFEGSGHYPFIEENERFLAVVRPWLAAHAEPGSTDRGPAMPDRGTDGRSDRWG